MTSLANNYAIQVYFIPSLIAFDYATLQIKIEMFFTQSELHNVVDGTKEALATSNICGLVAWKLKDSNTCSDILLHCGEKQLSFQLVKTSKGIWNNLKQLFKKLNKASQVHLHKKICHMTMSPSNDIP